jgi:RimJ/RimL family protein N-acetyltransferase
MDGDLMTSRLVRAGLRIEGARSWLVPFEARHRDDPDYLSWLRDPEVVRTLNLPDYLAAPVPAATVTAYCDALMRSDRDLMLALHDRDDGAFVGTLKAGHIDWHAGTGDVGIMIGRRGRWGRGLATDAIYALAHYLFDRIGLRKLTAGSMANNPAMIRTFERLGFVREGVFRRQDRLGDEYIDHIHFGCFAHELRQPPAGT